MKKENYVLIDVVKERWCDYNPFESEQPSPFFSRSPILVTDKILTDNAGFVIHMPAKKNEEVRFSHEEFDTSVTIIKFESKGEHPTYAFCVSSMDGKEEHYFGHFQYVHELQDYFPAFASGEELQISF